MSKPIIKLESVAVSYRKAGLFRSKEVNSVFQDLDLQVMAGETVGVIGRNGVGKSTLLRLITGIIKPDSGTVIRKTKRVALLTLTLGFVPDLSGRQNAILSSMLYGMTRSEAESLQDKILEFSELGHHFDRPISTYSSGMKARLGFAIALQSDPDVVLIDEVLAVGDIRFREKSSAAIKDLLAQGKTSIVVSHNLQEIRSLCSRVVWLHEGKLRMSGEAGHVVDEYKKVFAV